MKTSLKDNPLAIFMIPLGVIGLILTLVLVNLKKLPSKLHFLQRELPTWFVVLSIQCCIVMAISGFLTLAPKILVKPKNSFQDFYESPCYGKIGYRLVTDHDLTYEYSQCEQEFYSAEANAWFIGTGFIFGIAFLIVKFGGFQIPEKRTKEKSGIINDDLDSLERLDKLKQSGSLTEEEYAQLKKNIINKL